MPTPWDIPPRPFFTPQEYTRIRRSEGGSRGGTIRAESQDAKSATYMNTPRRKAPLKEKSK